MIWRNPILRRELLRDARCVRTAVAALALQVLLTAVLLLLWPRTGIFSDTNGQEIFAVFLNVNLALIILLVPAFTATTITQERESGSFDLLFMSQMTSAEILAGKLLASLGMTFLIVLMSMPLTAVCALSGGISVALLLRAYGVICLATLTYGLFGLAVSARCFRSFTALAATYLGILLLAGASWLPSVLLADLGGLGSVWRSIRALSPFEALFALGFPERYEVTVVGLDPEMALRIHTLGMIVLAVVFFLVFCRNVLRPPRARRARDTRQYTDRRMAWRRKLGFPFYLIDPLRRRKPIGRWRNPVYVAEIRSRIFGKPKFIARSLCALLVASMLVLFLVALQFATQLLPDTVRLVAIVFQIGVVAFFAPAVCSGSITDERAGGTLALLQMTQLPVRTIIAGKLKAGLLYVMLFLASSLPVLWALTYLESKVSYWRLVAWIVLLVLTATVFVVAGLCASSVTRSTAAATALSYGFSAVLCLGTLSVLLFGDRIAPPLRAAVLCFNPVAAALQIASDSYFAELPRLFGNRLWVNSLCLLAGLTVCLVGISALRVNQVFRCQV